MAHKRCTGCKEEVGEFGIRHKYHGGLFCERCMRSFCGVVRAKTTGRHILSNIWTTLKSLWHHVFDPRRFNLKTRKADTKHYSALAHAREIRERSIPIRMAINQKH